MSRTSRIGRITALAAITAALLLPAADAVAKAPVAHKSGAIINYSSTGKLKLAKHMFIFFTCTVTCDANSTTIIKGLGLKLTIPASGELPPGPGTLRLTVKGALLKFMKARPGAFKIVNTITATDPSTGATDRISHRFKLKR
jgi:hypothetical protein